MSTEGVIRMTVDALVKNQGRMTGPAYKAIVDYANANGLTAGEKKALLQPDFLKTSTALSRAGIAFGAIVYDAEAVKLASDLARTLGLTPALPGASSGGGTTTPVPTGDLAAAKKAVADALAKGSKLGSFADWSLQTTGADVKFAIDVRGKKYPALVLDKPQWKDAAARDIVKENAAAVSAVKTLAEFEKLTSGIVAKEKDYFEAKGVAAKSKNETYGIQNMRRKAFVAGMRSAVASSGMSSADRAGASLTLILASDKMISGRDYQMDVGSHTNYWPYWDNYLSPLLKVVDQLEKGSAEWHVVKNRIADILDRKTVFSWNREVEEKDFEVTLGGALVHNPRYSLTVGHRVSVKVGSRPDAPKYELLTVKSTGLADDMKQYAGAQVVRNTDGSLFFDFMEASAARAGQKLPAGLEKFVSAKDVAPDDLTLRKLESGETARSGISADWDNNGSVNVAKILIGWWGHCHNESPLNTLGIDPKKDVEMYRADRKVAKAKAGATYSSDDIWDVAGALAADHEDGYGTISGGNTRPVNVDDEVFVGQRNNGGHWLYLQPAFAGARRIRIDAEVTELWHKTDPTQKYPDPMRRFRRDIENADGSFAPNPDWVATGSSDSQNIQVDGAGRKMSVKTKYITFDAQGYRTEQEDSVTLDPSKDAFVKLSDEIQDRYPDGGGKVIEHWFNAKTQQYKSTVVDIANANGFKRKELSAAQPVKTKELVSEQETTFDSVMQIHDFVGEEIGLPFVFDTSSGMAVWNYPVDSIRVDLVKSSEKSENGATFTYTTYNLKYTTMGGPSGDVKYIIKRDAAGKMVRALALDPMPDFAFKYNHWVNAPVALGKNGEVAYNLAALNAGYLTDASRSKVVPALWERLVTLLYAGLSEKSGKDKGYVFEQTNGELLTFGSKADYDAAVAADMKLRDLEGGARV